MTEEGCFGINETDNHAANNQNNDFDSNKDSQSIHSYPNSNNSVYQNKDDPSENSNIKTKLAEFKKLFDYDIFSLFFLNYNNFKEDGIENNFTIYKKSLPKFLKEIPEIDNKIYLSHFYKEIPKEFDYTYFTKMVKCYASDYDRHLAEFKGFVIIEQEDYFFPLAFTERPVNGPLSYLISDAKTDPNFDKHKVLTNEQKFLIIVGIVYGIAFIHKHKFIHSNLNPTTVYLDKDYQSVICDYIMASPFKISEIMKEKESDDDDDKIEFKFSLDNKEPSKIFHNIEYVAPEILRGEEFSYESDIFSLGLLIFFILAEKNATFSVEGEIEFPDEFPKEWKKMIIQCILKDSKQRPSAISILNELLDEKQEFINSITSNSEISQISEKTNLILRLFKKNVENNLDYKICSLSIYRKMIPNIEEIDDETKLLISLAEKGDLQSIEKVGDLFHTGDKNFIKDDVNSYDCYKFAADKGSLYSLEKIAGFNEEGIGVDIDLEGSLEYYELILEKITENDQLRKEILSKIDEIKTKLSKITLINVPINQRNEKIINFFAEYKIKIDNIERNNENQKMTIQLSNFKDRIKALNIIKKIRYKIDICDRTYSEVYRFDSLKKYLPKINHDDFYQGENIYNGTFYDIYIYFKKVTNEPFFAKVYRRLTNDIIQCYKRDIINSSKFNYSAIKKYVGFDAFMDRNDLKLIILMKLFPVKSLEDTIHFHPHELNDTNKLKIIFGIANLLIEMHSKHITYRDLRTDNIFLNDNFEPMIVDLSLSKLDSNSIVLTSNVGTPIYMSPELFGEELDPIYIKESDSYAFGIFLYQILALVDIDHIYKTTIEYKIMKLKMDNYVPKIPDDWNDVFKYLIKSCWNSSINERPTPTEINNILINSLNSSNILLPDADISEVKEYINKLQGHQNEIKDINTEIYDLTFLLKKKIPKIWYRLSLIYFEGNHLLHDKKSLKKTDFIARGNFGEIYSFKNEENEKKYVGKIFYQLFKYYPEKQKIQTMKDLSIVLQLKHSCICQCHGFFLYGYDDEKHTIILNEYMQHGSLYEVINKKDQITDWNDTKKLINIYGIALGMFYLHSHDILHHNLSTKSILEDENLHPKISNICISNNFNNIQTSSKIIETTPFNAPEIFTKGEYTKASEVYSFGMIVYSIISDKYPDQYKDFSQIIEGIHPHFDESTPKVYQNLINCCLSNNPKDRPTFKDILDQLRNNHEFIYKSIDIKQYEDFINYTKTFQDNNNKIEPCPESVITEYLNLKNKKADKGEEEEEVKDDEEEQFNDEDQKQISFPFFKDLNTLSLKNIKEIKNIGFGGFGEIYLVQDKLTNVKFAAKVSQYEKIEKFSNLPIGINLIREIICHSEAKHEAIAKFIGYNRFYFKHKEKPVIFMEYFKKGDLNSILNIHDELRNKKVIKNWSDTNSLIVIYGIACAMKYLHSIGILHRDLNLSNILVDESLYPKLIDFGLSKKLSENDYNDNIKEIITRNHEESKPFGTKGFIAPEIYTNKEYSTKTDVYAFGIVVYEILSKTDPYKDINVYQVMHAFKNKKNYLDFKKINKSYHKLIKKCCSKDPKDRPSFEMIVKDLRENPEYITENIDEQAFKNYVEYIEKSISEQK